MSAPGFAIHTPRTALAALACTVWLAACGGGVYLGIELGGGGDQPPTVVLSAVDEAAAGAAVQLNGGATDDIGVESVAFYRIEGHGSPVLLDTDGESPYQTQTTIPASPPGTVWRYFARAFDGAGQSADSTPIEITVR